MDTLIVERKLDGSFTLLPSPDFKWPTDITTLANDADHADVFCSHLTAPYSYALILGRNLVSDCTNRAAITRERSLIVCAGSQLIDGEAGRPHGKSRASEYGKLHNSTHSMDIVAMHISDTPQSDSNESSTLFCK